MSKVKTAPPTPPALPYPAQGGSYVLDESAGILTPVPTRIDPASDAPVQTPVETTSEQETH